MSDAVTFVAFAALLGGGATAVLDVFSAALKLFFGLPAPDYGLVGRWIAYMPQGRFHHDFIGATAPIAGEGIIGWTAHYVIGMAYAALLLAIWGMDWVFHPTIGPALIVGVSTVAAPFLIMQPGMGAGVASSRTPNPTVARLRSLAAHTVFGLGLYLAGSVMSLART
jgi:hypothetical protein